MINLKDSNKTKIVILIISIFLFALLMYLNLLRYYIPITENIVPFGDPFTYEIAHYNFLNIINNDGNLIEIIKFIIINNWYWLQKILIFFFSPILINEPYSLSLINFFLYATASSLLFILSLELNNSKSLSFLLSLLVWTYPINYHFWEYSALPVMGLDSTFLGSLYCLILSYLIFIQRNNSFYYQILFSIFLCAAVLGRGNSITLIALIIFIPSLHLLIKLIKERDITLLKSLFIPICFFTITISIFYYYQLSEILAYYSQFKKFITINLDTMQQYIKHVPGIFFLYPERSEVDLINGTDFRVFSISLLIHFINFISLFLFINKKNQKLKLIYFTGYFIFYATFFINLIMWMTPFINIYNAGLIWAPMRIGFVLIAFSILIVLLNKINSKFIYTLNLVVIVSIFFTSNILYKNYQKNIFKYKIDSSPSNIKQIRDFIKKNSKQKEAMILWYGPYLNHAILNYYSTKDNLDTITWFQGKYGDEMWISSFTSMEYQKKVDEGIENIFDNANLIIMNDNTNNYKLYPYGWARYNKFITKQIKLGKLENFIIIGKIKAQLGNLLIMKRTEDEISNFRYEITEGDKYEIFYENIEYSF